MRSIKLDAFVKGRESCMVLKVMIAEREMVCMYLARRGVVVIRLGCI